MNGRAERLRLVEALLFAADEPLGEMAAVATEASPDPFQYGMSIASRRDTHGADRKNPKTETRRRFGDCGRWTIST
jgi:hypothetical protein